MTARQAILEYLKVHRSFTSSDVSSLFGLRRDSVRLASRALIRERVIEFDRRNWRTVYYRLASDDEKSGLVSTNLIFQECRQSEAMKRVLNFYGVRA